ncbi:MAG: hypothetical protein WC025_03990, partial [Candidatus Magasanikbacteria bacterium]
DVLLLVADMNESKIQADPDLPAIGTVIESNVDKGMGPVATVLIQSGTLHRGDKLVLNNEIYGKVRAMKNYKADLVDEAGPSVPIQIIGFKIAPEVGDVLDITRQNTATEINLREKKSRQTGAERTIIVDNDESSEENKKTLNIIVKADVLGSLEAIVSSFEKIRHAEVGVKIIGKGLGNITEDDVKKASTSGATVIGFNVNATPLAGSMMREENVQFLQYDVIYDLINWVKEELGRLLSDEKIITEFGIMKVVAIFRKEKGAMIVGGRIESGKVMKNVLARVKREKLDVGNGKITECRLGQSVTKEVHEGMECGVRFEGKSRLEVDDVLEFYTEETKAREIQFL